MKKIGFLFAIVSFCAFSSRGDESNTKLLTKDRAPVIITVCNNGKTIDSAITECSNGVVKIDRLVIAHNKLFLVHDENIVIKDSSMNGFEPKLNLILNLDSGVPKDKSVMHGGVWALHGLFYMAGGFKIPGIAPIARVDVYSTEDKKIIVAMILDNGPIYSSTNSGITWTITKAPGKYDFPLSVSPEGDVSFAEATLYPSSDNRTSTNANLSSPDWYAIGSSPDGNKLVINGNGSPALSIKHTANSVILSWSSQYSGFIAQQNSDLTTANWLDLTNSISLVGQEYQVIISTVNGNCFCRLRSKTQ